VPVLTGIKGFEALKGTLKSIMDSDAFKTGMGVAVSAVNEAEKLVSPATYYGREALAAGLDTNTGKEIVKTLDAIPPNMGGGWEDDAARGFTQFAKYMKDVAPEAGTLAAVPGIVKFRRNIMKAGSPEYWAKSMKTAVSVPGAIKLPEESRQLKLIRAQNTPGDINPNNRRGGQYFTANNPGSEHVAGKGYLVQHANPAEGGKHLIEANINPVNPLPLRSTSWFGNSARSTVGIGGNTTGTRHYSQEYVPKPTQGRSLEQLRDLSSGGNPSALNEVLPKRIRLNNADVRKINQGPRTGPLGVSTDALGDYLINKYAKSYGYDAAAPGRNLRHSGMYGEEIMVPSTGRHDVKDAFQVKLPVGKQSQSGPKLADTPWWTGENAKALQEDNALAMEKLKAGNKPVPPAGKLPKAASPDYADSPESDWGAELKPIPPPKHVSDGIQSANPKDAALTSLGFEPLFGGTDYKKSNKTGTGLSLWNSNQSTGVYRGSNQIHSINKLDIKSNPIMHPNGYPNLAINELGPGMYTVGTPGKPDFISVVPGHSVKSYGSMDASGKLHKSPKENAMMVLADWFNKSYGKASQFPKGFNEGVGNQIEKIAETYTRPK